MLMALRSPFSRLREAGPKRHSLVTVPFTRVPLLEDLLTRCRDIAFDEH